MQVVAQMREQNELMRQALVNQTSQIEMLREQQTQQAKGGDDDAEEDQPQDWVVQSTLTDGQSFNMLKGHWRQWQGGGTAHGRRHWRRQTWGGEEEDDEEDEKQQGFDDDANDEREEVQEEAVQEEPSTGGAGAMSSGRPKGP